ncbi:MAG: ORF6N domain-containing protein [Elusimicrobia bacterium]|nr:ORF6N domain-containing protein [Elusimicrobiota bacterium]
MKEIIPYEAIETKIYIIRDRKIMIDKDLAMLYGVETRALNQAVRRNLDRFPKDFVMTLTRTEIKRISQIVTSSNLKFSKVVFAFTEEGIAMLSSVLKSQRAIQVNITIMRTFVKLRKMLSINKDLSKRLNQLENKYDAQFKIVFDAIRELMAPPEKPKKRIGFSAKEKRARYLAKK